MAPSKETKTSLPISGTTFERALLEQLRRAASRLPGRDPRAHLFLESRHERRIEVTGDGPPVAVGGHLQGLAAEPSPGTGVFVAAPPAEAIEEAARGRLLGTGAVPRVHACELPDPSDLVQALTGLVRRTSSAARVTWTEVDQQVAVACRDGRLGTDRRRGRRVALRLGHAVEERVLSDTEPLHAVLDGLGPEVAARARALADAGPPPAGPGWVVFAPGAGGVLLHELIGHGLEADTIARGESRLASGDGPVAGPGVTVLDDPRRARVPWRMDDEGTEAGPTALLQSGRVAGALGSWRWPGRRGVSTGHGRRVSFAEPVLPRMGATFLASGPLGPDEVLEGTARGVYVRRLAAAWTDPAQGVATFHVGDADVVRGGRIERALRPFLLVARLEDLASLDRIAGDLAFDRCGGACVREGQALASSVGAPTFRLGLTTVPL